MSLRREVYGGRLWAGLVVQHLGELLQAGHDLRRLGQDGAGQFLGVIRPALRHFRESHHDRKRVVNRVLDLAEFLLHLRDLFLRNGVRRAQSWWIQFGGECRSGVLD